LETITPKEMDLKIINTTSQNIIQEQEIWTSSKIFEKIKNKKNNDMEFKDYIPQGIRIGRLSYNLFLRQF
jgi:hypothetical protein